MTTRSDQQIFLFVIRYLCQTLGVKTSQFIIKGSMTHLQNIVGGFQRFTHKVTYTLNTPNCLMGQPDAGKGVHWGPTPFRVKYDPEISQPMTRNMTQSWVNLTPLLVQLTEFRSFLLTRNGVWPQWTPFPGQADPGMSKCVKVGISLHLPLLIQIFKECFSFLFKSTHFQIDDPFFFFLFFTLYW